MIEEAGSGHGRRGREFLAVAKRAKWSDADTLQFAVRRIDALEAELDEKRAYQTKLVGDIRRLEAELATLDGRLG